MIPYKDRAEKLKPPKDFPDGYLWYSYLTNDWIPNQPDWYELMILFIEFDFSGLSFCKYVVQGIKE